MAYSPANFATFGARAQAPAMRALAPHWGTLVALALFLVAGLVVLDDHGVTVDEGNQRTIAARNIDYLLGWDDSFESTLPWVRLYGIAFEAPLFAADRVLGLDDSRSIHLSRHLIAHLVFLLGGFFAYLLAHRLFNNRTLAALAMLVFLLHPRIYAHSFFNTKDVPFLVMFIVALSLAHRAFRRDVLWAFVPLGIGVGVLVNLRVMGVVLLAAVLALRALDFALAQGWPERKRILVTAGAFALAVGLTVFALIPYLWGDPAGRAVEWWTTFSDYPTTPSELFRGMLYRSVDFPIAYLPAWLSITSPPFALLLGLIGAGVVLVKAARSPRAAIRSGRLRFGLLLVGCAAATVAAVMLLDANIYSGGRHVYFLWAPFALLAAWGLAWVASAVRRARFRAAVYGAAGAGAAMTLISMALIHPNQQVYFNFSVDRVTPEHLRTQYVMNYWGHSTRQALEWVASNAHLFPNDAVVVAQNSRLDLLNAAILPDAARADVAANPAFDIVPGRARFSWSRSNRVLHRVQVYGNTIASVEPMDDLRAVYEATRGRQPIIDSAFDVYWLDGAAALVMEPCAPSFLGAQAFLRAIPVDAADLPPWRERRQSEPRIFNHGEYGALLDGKCVVSLPLPSYPIAEFRIAWNPELIDDGDAREAMRRAREEGRLLARSVYDVHLADDELVYIQEPCNPDDTEPRFFLNIYPQREDDLPEEWRARGFEHERRRFGFLDRGALLPEACVALFPLPDYPAAGFRTGQSREDGDNLWRASFSANPERYAAAYRAVAGSAPLARGAFDIHLLDGGLVYVKEPCGQADTEARFFLHLEPERVSDLPEGRREYGFDNLDFTFFLNGAWFDGRCAARVPLPDYPVASIRTGQFVSGAGETWSAEFAVAEP